MNNIMNYLALTYIDDILLHCKPSHHRVIFGLIFLGFSIHLTHIYVCKRVVDTNVLSNRTINISLSPLSFLASLQQHNKMILPGQSHYCCLVWVEGIYFMSLSMFISRCEHNSRCVGVTENTIYIVFTNKRSILHELTVLLLLLDKFLQNIAITL